MISQKKRKMDKRSEQIIAWCRKTRPDTVQSVEGILNMAYDNPNDRRVQALSWFLYAGFEAGRTFQRENPTASEMPDAYAQEG